MKNKIAIASAFLAASSFSMGEIVINDFLSFEGFVDMNYVHYDAEIDAEDFGIDELNESDNDFQVQQVEIVWLFDFDPVTAQVDLEYENNGELDSDLDVDQAFVTYHFDNGGAITAGRYDSMLGFEAFEKPGLYQYSFAYGLPMSVTGLLSDLTLGVLPEEADEALGLVSSAIFPLPVTNQGVKYTYESDTMFFGASLQDGIYGYGDRLGGDDADDLTARDGGGYGGELAFAFRPGNGLTYFLGGAYEQGDGYSFGPIEISEDTDAWVINTYLTYETGAWIFAFEVNYGEQEWEDILGGTDDLETESLSGLLMANFAYSEQASITGRVSYVDFEAEVDSDDLEGDALKFTLAHNYAFTDNLLLVTEVSYTDGEVEVDGDDGDFEELLGAIELLFTF